MLSVDRIAAALDPIKLDEGELAEVLESLRRVPRPAIRLRPGVDPGSLSFESEPVAWHPQGRLLPVGFRPGATLGFAAADYYVQDVASLLAITALDARPGELICDLCASPGGKSTAVLEALGDEGWLLSNEAVESRVGMLEFNLARHGSVRYVVSRRDPEQLAEQLAGTFDAVLVDAPCSGQSLLARGKQSEAAFAPRTMGHCAARQTRILDAAARLVRSNGRLVYSTCTFAFAENEGQVESFLSQHEDWSLEPVNELTPWQSDFGVGHYRVWPHRHGSGGAYAARLRCSQKHVAVSADTPRGSADLRPCPWPEPLNEWGELINSVAFRIELQTFGWPIGVHDKLLRIGLAGPEVGFRKAATWFPSYALAMRRDPNWIPHRQFQLDDTQAAQYLQGHSLPGTLRGWSVATWNGRALGWLKGDGTRMKNHLPKPGRIQVK